MTASPESGVPLPTTDGTWFTSVSKTAKEFRVSPMTLYRMIESGEYAALQLGARLVVPASPTSPRVTLPRFLSVPLAARQVGVSKATLYRLIEADVFPALRFRRRRVVAAVVIYEMATAAIETNSLIDPAAWVATAPSGGVVS